MRRSVVAAVLTSVLIAGCGGSDASPEGTPTATTAPGRELIRFERDGGRGGGRVQKTLTRSGRLTIEGRRPEGDVPGAATEVPVSFTLSSADLARVKRAIAAARIRSDASYTPAQPVADGITDQVTVDGHVVAVAAGADAPRRVEALVKLLVSLP